MKASDKPGGSSSGTITHSITEATGNDWTNTAKQYNFTVNNADAGCVRLYVNGNDIMGACANSQNELYSYKKLFTITSGSASHSITPAYNSSNDWNASAKQYNFTVNGTDAGYVRIERSGNTIYGYYADSQDVSDALAEELFVFSGGSSTPSSVTYSIVKDTWDDSTKKFNFQVNGSDAGFVSFYIYNGTVRYSYQDNSSGNGESGYWLTLENGSASHDPHISYEATGNGYMVSSTVFFREYRIWAECEGVSGPSHYAWMREIDDE